MRSPCPLTCLAVLLLVGCGKDPDVQGLILEPTPVKHLPTLYGVILSPQLFVRSEGREDAPVVTVLPRGVIVEIESIAPRKTLVQGQSGRWLLIRYQGRKGWVFDAFVRTFESLPRAQLFVQELARRHGTD